MATRQNEKPIRVCSLGIEQWRQLGEEGSLIPVTITLHGESMRPLVRRDRDRVTILPLMRRLRVGDVVLFKSNTGRFVVHRVYRLDGKAVQTMGDHCHRPDPWIQLDQVWGLVVSVERDGRRFSLNNRGARLWGRCWMALLPLKNSWALIHALSSCCFRHTFFAIRKGSSASGE